MLQTRRDNGEKGGRRGLQKGSRNNVRVHMGSRCEVCSQCYKKTRSAIVDIVYEPWAIFFCVEARRAGGGGGLQLLSMPRNEPFLRDGLSIQTHDSVPIYNLSCGNVFELSPVGFDLPRAIGQSNLMGLTN